MVLLKFLLSKEYDHEQKDLHSTMVLLKYLCIAILIAYIYNLHSTMVLLKLRFRIDNSILNFNLHSTMVLLKFSTSEYKLLLSKGSTFHYGSIKIAKCSKTFTVSIVIYIPLWFY